jgi:hypothetical protein
MFTPNFLFFIYINIGDEAEVLVLNVAEAVEEEEEGVPSRRTGGYPLLRT